MSADIDKIYRDGANQRHDDYNVEIANLEFRVVDAAEAWFNDPNTTEQGEASCCDHKALYNTVRALIAAREK